MDEPANAGTVTPRVGGQRLHYVEAGDGPLILLLHGFPEFWYGWRQQIEPLAAAGFRVVAPDLRGYNLSSKPAGVGAYDTGQLTGDIRGLIQERGAESALLVGHDWGGTVAWATAMHHPEVVDRLAILDAAHPRKLSQDCTTPTSSGSPGTSSSSRSRSCPKPSCTPTAGTSSGISCTTPTRPTRRRRSTATSTRGRGRGAATGMINYYRSSVRQSPKRAEAQLRPISAPTLVIWGQRDRYLGPELAEPDHDDVPNLDRVERLPDASHWVHHDEHERVTQLLIDFFAPARPTGNGSRSTSVA